MPNTYYSDKVVLNTAGVNTIEPKYNASSSSPVIATFPLTAALGINDIINMMDIPPNVWIMDWTIDTAQLDTGTPAITLALGTAATPTMFVAVSTVGQAGGIVRATLAGTVGRTFAVTTRIQIKVIAGPGTGATTGNLVLFMNYTGDK